MITKDTVERVGALIVMALCASNYDEMSLAGKEMKDWTPVVVKESNHIKMKKKKSREKTSSS